MEVGFSSKMRQNTIIFYSRYFDKYLFNYMTYKLDKNVMLLTYIAKRDNNLYFSYVETYFTLMYDTKDLNSMGKMFLFLGTAMKCLVNNTGHIHF